MEASSASHRNNWIPTVDNTSHQVNFFSSRMNGTYLLIIVLSYELIIQTHFKRQFTYTNDSFNSELLLFIIHFVSAFFFQSFFLSFFHFFWRNTYYTAVKVASNYSWHKASANGAIPRRESFENKSSTFCSC